jgi:gliding motility-associated-like protein
LRWRITNSCGLTQDDIKITVINSTIPNAMSPNGDGKNDVFIVPDLERYAVVKLVVFNRWGSQVYEDENYKNNWQGTNMQNVPLTDDTYYYTLTRDGNTITGFVIIKR